MLLLRLNSIVATAKEAIAQGRNKTGERRKENVNVSCCLKKRSNHDYTLQVNFTVSLLDHPILL